MINLLCGVTAFDQTDQEPVKQPEEEDEILITVGFSQTPQNVSQLFFFSVATLLLIKHI